MKKIAAVLSLVAVAGCVRTNAALIDPAITYARTCPQAVRLFTSAADVPQPYQQVALLNSSGESSWSDESGMIRSMREKAAEVGANGIILNAIDEPSALTKVIGDVAKTGTVRKGKSVAVFIPADVPKAKATCASQAEKK